MNLNDYKQLIDKDTAFLKAESNIDLASLSVPELMFKYQQAIYEEALVLQFMENERDIIKKKRWLYYTGKADPEVYKEEGPVDIKILRSDMDIFLNADEKLNVQKAKVKEQQLKLNLIEAFTKTIMSLSFNVGNTIKWKKFLVGEIG